MAASFISKQSCDVRLWHLADMTTFFVDGRFSPGSGHSKVRRQCPLMTVVSTGRRNTLS